jgi:hypothetical protein
VPHGAVGAPAQDRLQANHGYTWQLAAMTSDATRNADNKLDPTAYSVAVDYFGAFAGFTGVAPTAKANGPVNEFVTGAF